MLGFGTMVNYRQVDIGRTGTRKATQEDIARPRRCCSPPTFAPVGRPVGPLSVSGGCGGTGQIRRNLLASRQLPESVSHWLPCRTVSALPRYASRDIGSQRALTSLTRVISLPHPLRRFVTSCGLRALAGRGSPIEVPPQAVGNLAKAAALGVGRLSTGTQQE